MCGFVGIFDPLGRREPARDLVRRMTAALAHRGPDGDGFHFEAGLALGHRRLAIIDLPGGKQPIYNEDGSIAVVYNGEIYNYRELRRELSDLGHRFATASDTEVIVHAWEEWGEDCLNRFAGMFAFALWDREKETLLLARDRLGKKPLYYAVLDDGWLIFASELKSLLLHPGFRRAVEPTAVENYFTYGYVPDPQTIFKTAFKLEPASLLTWRRGEELQQRPYWRLAMTEDLRGRPQDLQAELLERLAAAVGARLAADVPLGAFLSGGVDSGGVVALMAEQAAAKVDAFTVSFNDPRWDETPYAASVAARYGAHHKVETVAPQPDDCLKQMVDIFDEPFADSSALPTFRISAFARRHVTVALSGDGGDELFGGYRRYLWHVNEERVRRALPTGARRRLFGALAAFYPRLDWAPRALRARTTLHELSLDSLEGYKNNVAYLSDATRRGLYGESFRRELQGYDGQEVLRRHMPACEGVHPLLQAQYLDIKTYLPGDILVKVDRASMANSLEVRVPLLDHTLVEWAARLPAGLKLHGREGKWLLKRALAPKLPAELLQRRKQGFSVPLADWLRGPLRAEVRQLLTGEVLGDSGILSMAAVRRLLEEHETGRRDNSTALWSLVVFCRFLERTG
jgi:asparagine synthase (glutamine-hydrolysing)